MRQNSENHSPHSGTRVEDDQTSDWTPRDRKPFVPPRPETFPTGATLPSPPPQREEEEREEEEEEQEENKENSIQQEQGTQEQDDKSTNSGGTEFYTPPQTPTLASTDLAEPDPNTRSHVGHAAIPTTIPATNAQVFGWMWPWRTAEPLPESHTELCVAPMPGSYQEEDEVWQEFDGSESINRPNDALAVTRSSNLGSNSESSCYLQTGRRRVNGIEGEATGPSPPPLPHESVQQQTLTEGSAQSLPPMIRPSGPSKTYFTSLSHTRFPDSTTTHNRSSSSPFSSRDSRGNDDERQADADSEASTPPRAVRLPFRPRTRALLTEDQDQDGEEDQGRTMSVNNHTTRSDLSNIGQAVVPDDETVALMMANDDDFDPIPPEYRLPGASFVPSIVGPREQGFDLRNQTPPGGDGRHRAELRNLTARLASATATIAAIDAMDTQTYGRFQDNAAFSSSSFRPTTRAMDIADIDHHHTAPTAPITSPNMTHNARRYALDAAVSDASRVYRYTAGPYGAALVDHGMPIPPGFENDLSQVAEQRRTGMIAAQDPLAIETELGVWMEMGLTQIQFQFPGPVMGSLILSPVAGLPVRHPVHGGVEFQDPDLYRPSAALLPPGQEERQQQGRRVVAGGFARPPPTAPAAMLGRHQSPTRHGYAASPAARARIGTGPLRREGSLDFLHPSFELTSALESEEEETGVLSHQPQQRLGGHRGPLYGYRREMLDENTMRTTYSSQDGIRTTIWSSNPATARVGARQAAVSNPNSLLNPVTLARERAANPPTRERPADEEHSHP